MYLYSQELTISRSVADKTLETAGVDRNTFSSCNIGLGSINILTNMHSYFMQCIHAAKLQQIQDRAHTCPSLEISDLFIQRSNFAFGR